MKQIIAIWHKSGKGKSETIRQIANQFLLIYPSATPIFPSNISIPPTGDFRLIVQAIIKGVHTTVAFESQGDPGTWLEERLEDLAINFNCDIIFCTCRTRGETIYAVEHTASNYNLNIIWSSTYEISGQTNQTIANQQKGIHIIQLLQALTIL